MTTLSLKSLSRFYGDVAIVDRLSIDLRAGEFLSLLGPSGCGKTTTLRMIAGFVEPSEGTIEMDGKVISSPERSLPPEARNMSMIFQSYAVWPHMTIFENVAFGLQLRKIPAAEIARRVKEVLELVQMGHLAARYPAELSGGQQQRVALARAVVIRPSVLLLDEPLSNLDATLREEMRREIRQLHDAVGFTTVYVTHDQAEAMSASDRIAIMRNGRVEQIADPRTIYSQPATAFVASFIGRANFFTARADGRAIQLDTLPLGFDLPEPTESGRVTLSLRPQSIRLHPARPTAPMPGGGLVQVDIRERTYLGEAWQYQVIVRDDGPVFTVTAPSAAYFSIGDSVWADLDFSEAMVLRS